MSKQLTNLLNDLEEFKSEKESDFQLADGADSNFHYLEGFVDCLDYVIGIVKTEIEGN